jgi:C-terminal processing protease CtpA/Prc
MSKYLLAFSFAVALFHAESLCAADQTPPKGGGFSVQVYTEGFFLNPNVARLVVLEVFPNSQASDAGLAPGDEIIQVETLAVPGTKARDLEPLMEFKPGVPKRLILRRPNGTQYEVTFTKSKS